MGVTIVALFGLAVKIWILLSLQSLKAARQSFFYHFYDRNTYWMLYDLTTEPDVANAPDDRFLAPLGVSSLKVLDNHSYLFWYKNINTASDPSDVNQSEDSNEDSDFYN